MLCWESQLRSHVGCHIFFPKGQEFTNHKDLVKMWEDCIWQAYPSRHGSYPAVELTPYTMQSLQVFWHCISEQHEHTWSTTIKIYTLSVSQCNRHDLFIFGKVSFIWKKILGPSWDSPTSILHLPPTCYHPTWNHDDSQVVALILPAWRRHILEKVLSEACRQICIDLSICFFFCVASRHPTKGDSYQWYQCLFNGVSKHHSDLCEDCFLFKREIYLPRFL